MGNANRIRRRRCDPRAAEDQGVRTEGSEEAVSQGAEVDCSRAVLFCSNLPRDSLSNLLLDGEQKSRLRRYGSEAFADGYDPIAARSSASAQIRCRKPGTCLSNLARSREQLDAARWRLRQSLTENGARGGEIEPGMAFSHTRIIIRVCREPSCSVAARRPRADDWDPQHGVARSCHIWHRI